MQGASSAIENGLKNLGKVVLDFAMKTAGLGGLAQKVKQGIVNIKGKVDAFLNKLLERVKPWINKVLGKGSSSGTAPPGKSEFKSKADQEAHHLVLAQTASSDLKAGAPKAGDYKDVRAYVDKQKDMLEQKYNPKLGKDFISGKTQVTMQITLPTAALEDAKDNNVDFKIWIGPNDTNLPGHIPVGGSSARVSDADVDRTQWHPAAKEVAKDYLAKDTSQSLKTMLDLHAKLKTSPLYSTPVNTTANPFATAMWNDFISSSVNTVFAKNRAALDKEKATTATLWNSSKPLINKAENPFYSSKAKMQAHLFDVREQGSVQNTLEAELDKKAYYMTEGQDHDWYKPKTTTRRIDNGYVVIEYETQSGQKFTVRTQIGQSYPEEISGEFLTFKPPGTRGSTTGVPVKNVELDSAHLIADDFKGSGYAKAKNTIPVSAPYNRQIMGGAEGIIRDSVKRTAGYAYFSLNVKVTYEEVLEKTILDDIYNKLCNDPAFQRYNPNRTITRASLETDILTRLDLNGKGNKLRRVKKVEYSWVVKDVNGKALISPENDTTIGLDPYMGLED